MGMWNWLKQTPLWLVVPSVFLAAGVATAVMHYEPLVFDPSLYEVQTADAAELSTIDAEALEAAHATDEPPVDVELAVPSSAVTSGAALADGTWTGYAACGQGNPDGWKPYYVGVTVSVSGGKVAGISRIFGASTGNAGSAALNWDADENQKYLDWAISGRNGSSGVRSQLVGSSVVSSVDTVSGATYSSAAIFNAYVDALGKAAKAAGGDSPVSAAMSASASKPDSSKSGSPKAKSKAAVGKLADGTWTAYAQCGPDPDDSWKPYYIGVTLTVKDGKPASIDKVFASSKGEKGSRRLVYDKDENKAYFENASYGAGMQLEKATKKGKVLGGIDTVSGATFSSESIYEAYYAALRKSAQAAGSTVEASEDEEDDATGEDPAPGPGDSAEQVEGEPFYGYAYCSSPGSDNWNPYYLFLQVAAVDGKVVGVTGVFGDADGIVDPDVVYSASENELYFNWAVDGKFGGTGYRMKSVVRQI